MRLPSKGFKYVYVEDDGSVTELTKEDRDYLVQKFHPGDGNRPYIKLNYWQRTPDKKLGGFLRRIRVPWWIAIKRSSTA